MKGSVKQQAGACSHHPSSREACAARPEVRRHSGDYCDDDPAHLFDPARFVETQKPLLEASTLPAECYNSREWYNREMERSFMPSWTLIGMENEIMEPGSYLAIDTEWSGPIAVCRGKQGELHAFANVCCHRGAKVLQGACGKSSPLGHVCPYHAWTYEYDGALKWAPGMKESQNFDEDSVRLPPVRMEVFHGFIFVCASEETPYLLSCLGDLPAQLEPWFGLDGAAKSMVCVKRREYEVECNWKFLMENTCETYHTSVVHKDSLGPMKAEPMPPHVGEWDAVRVPTSRSVVPLPSDFEGVAEPLPAFTDQTSFVNLFPSLQINVTHDCMWWMRLFPQGPEKTLITMGFCFPEPTTRLTKFPATLEFYLKRWHMAVSEDNEISLNQQRGVRSVFRTPGRFTQLEFGTHNFNNWLLSKMLDNQLGSWDPGQRVFTGKGEIWSNDSAQMLKVVEEAKKAERESLQQQQDEDQLVRMKGEGFKVVGRQGPALVVKKYT